MTKNEVQDYLHEYYNYRKGVVTCVNALKRNIVYARRYFPGYISKTYINNVEESIKNRQDEANRKAEIITEWSKYIEFEPYRLIFIDRYINGLPWSDIEAKHCYEHSNIFRIQQICCECIADGLNPDDFDPKMLTL